MTIYNNKTILLIDGINQIDATFVHGFLESGAKEVRILDGSETTIQALRGDLLAKNLEATERLRFFVGDLSDNHILKRL